MDTPIACRTFAVVAIGAASAVAAALLTARHEDARHRTPPEVHQPVVQTRPERPTPAADAVTDHPRYAARRAAREDLPTGATPPPRLIDPGLARSAAKRFVLALLRRERGTDTRAAARTIRTTATLGLADFVLARHPRMPAAAGARPAPARLVRIRLSSSGRRGAAAVATISRGPQTAALAIQLVHRGGRWRVGALG